MKTVLLLLSVFFIGMSSINAQDKNLSDELKKEMKQNFEETGKRLKLTEAQKKSFWAVNTKYLTKVIAVKNSEDGPMEKLKAAMDLLQMKNNELKPILTDAQYKTYLQIQQEKIQKAKEKMKG